MLYSGNLLKRYINVSKEPNQIGNQLTMKSCEIEEVHTRQIPEQVVIGKTTEVTKHPDADTLFVCQVDCGSNGKYQIITGGENIVENKFVAVILPGGYLPAIDLQIGSREMRGLKSDGMICSKQELGIPEDEDKHWIWLMEEDLHDLTDQDIGKPLIEKYPWMGGFVFDVENKTLTHRPDLTGHFGLAIELNAIYASESKSITYAKVQDYIKTFRDTNILEVIQNSTKGQVPVQGKSEGLNNYLLLEINDIQVKISDMFARLYMLDLNLGPRNNWVDFSNLFLYLTGQPIHFFDKSKIDGQIIIRDAQEGEKFTDLFDHEHTLTSNDIVIADNSKILALAGVIGGGSSGVDENTKDILVEIANFDPVRVRKTGTRLGLRTDAELRFEKNISPIWTLYTLIMFLDELKIFAPTLGDYKIGGLSYYIKDESNIMKMKNKTIKVDYEDMSKFIFGQVKPDFKAKAQTILTGLGFVVQDDEVQVPVWRGPGDINISADIYEEVARIYGYDEVSEQVFTDKVVYTPYTQDIALTRALEEIVIQNNGFNQTETYAWVDDELLEKFDVDTSKLLSVKNPSAPNQRLLRDSLVYNICSAIAKNSKFMDKINIFEIGKIWEQPKNIDNRKKTRTESEKENIILASYLKSVKSRDQDTVLYLKGMVGKIVELLGLQGLITYKPSTNQNYHPKKQAEIYLNDKQIGFVGQVHPMHHEHLKLPENAQISILELSFDTIKELLAQVKVSMGASEYETLQDQIIYRDLSFIIDKDQQYGDVVNTLNKIKEIKDVQVFDLYAGENLPQGKKSISVQIKIIGDGHMKTEQINEVMDKAIKSVTKVGAQLRG